ncbi:MAG: Ig-like domain-containing protein [Gemmatimonadaceae bacterium]
MHSRVARVIRFAPSLMAMVAIVAPLAAQQPAVTRLVAEPASLTLKAGDEAPIKVTAYDAQGRVVVGAAVRLVAQRSGLMFTEGKVKAIRAGKYEAIASSGSTLANGAVTLTIPVTVTWPAIAKVTLVADAGHLYTGVALDHRVVARHADGGERPAAIATWRSSNAGVASVDRFGTVTGLKPGTTTISADVEGVSGTQSYTVTANPVASIELAIKENSVRTGDVVHLVGKTKRANGAVVTDAPITWTYTYIPDDSIAAPGGPGIIDGGVFGTVFAANAPGRFTIHAQSGAAHASTVIEAKPRDVRQRITVTGRGTIRNQHSSDLWPWTGKDGRDYCLVGTWGADGYAMVFDITDMTKIVKTDSIKVDARTINDVTVSPDGRYGALSREGASNRINGVVLLDLAVPAHPKIAAGFDQELTGGVHNMFATNDNLFAVSGGAKYVIIDTKDIYHPKYVSEYRHPNARIHDLWVHDGIAYSAQGGVGAVVVDVGNGKYGGTIEKPKLITTFPINSGHEIYPYFQKKTGKVYLFMGDEEMRTGRVWEGTTFALSGPDGKPPEHGIAQTLGGYTHIIDFTDPMHPKQVAKYHLEDYGSHDIIVQDDILYQAYYQGGVRLVDVSGELLGNLADQRREIAAFLPNDPEGYTANAPFVMNAMPWKGQVIFTDFNSGLWAAKLEPKAPVVP